MTREQIRQHKDNLDNMDAMSERILNLVCVGAGVALVFVLLQAVQIIGG